MAVYQAAMAKVQATAIWKLASLVPLVLMASPGKDEGWDGMRHAEAAPDDVKHADLETPKLLIAPSPPHRTICRKRRASALSGLCGPSNVILKSRGRNL